jgi:hypothetical protein
MLNRRRARGQATGTFSVGEHFGGLARAGEAEKVPVAWIGAHPCPIGGSIENSSRPARLLTAGVRAFAVAVLDAVPLFVVCRKFQLSGHEKPSMNPPAPQRYAMVSAVSS